ncbi:MAG TPA: biotin--[acetyl-CoA-carboxylase] ligase [Candidatus Saccharimonadales bacterium]|nr:biotin--[acetyl-CoA-carboxylase] ligase [Candidatus Saccharimonadales bacterium]
MPDRLALLAFPAVRSALQGVIGRDIHFHASLPSTQDRARELAADGGPPAVVVADLQTAGHGRGDRTWQAGAGQALLASWLLRPMPSEPALFSLLGGVAVCRALDALGAPRGGLKWPNDVWYDGRKVAGVLAHAAAETLVVGIGVNVSQAAADFPSELAGIATSLRQAAHEVDRLALLIRLTVELERVADPTFRAAALDEWRGRAVMLGREVEVREAGVPPFRGRAEALADDGALVVGTAYGQQRILAGEVSLVL